jgi:hypothetical protein
MFGRIITNSTVEYGVETVSSKTVLMSAEIQPRWCRDDRAIRKPSPHPRPTQDFERSPCLMPGLADTVSNLRIRELCKGHP